MNTTHSQPIYQDLIEEVCPFWNDFEAIIQIKYSICIESQKLLKECFVREKKYRPTIVKFTSHVSPPAS